MRAYVVAACMAIALFLTGVTTAWGAQVDPSDIEHLFKSLNAQGATEKPRFLRESDGFMRFVGTPPGAVFESQGKFKATGAEPIARAFVTEHGKAFGAFGAKTSFSTKSVKSSGDRGYVRLQQEYNGIDVFGAEMMVQTDNSRGGVACIQAKVLRDTEALDTGALSLSPQITASAAQLAAIAWAADKYTVAPSKLSANGAERYVYSPELLGAPGTLCVVWRTVVTTADAALVKEVVLVDASNGKVVLGYTLNPKALYREIYDGANTYTEEGVLVRREGDPPSSVMDANYAYDNLGDTYAFYYNTHGRDSLDNAGMRLWALVRYCNPYYECPIMNAFGGGGRMYFGDGYAYADDVVGHELTHVVTDFESNLIYAYQPGAINESLSDMWGEFVDLTNSRGNDTASVRWLMGEDLPDGAIRSMKNPLLYGDPDRLKSPYYRDWDYGWDYGGVHYNSGITNKLCYLLVDGDTFNGQTVQGIGITKAAKLFYEMQTNLLGQSSDFYDFYMLMGQAATNLGYSYAERLNVRAAGRAVEINPPGEEGITQFRAIPTVNRYNRPVIALNWANPDAANFRQMILVRSTTGYPTSPEDGVTIYSGRDEKYLDSTVESGTLYYYTIFEDVDTGYPELRSTRCRAGVETPDFLTEEFFSTSTSAGVRPNPFDLSYSQILFTPTGAPSGGIGSTQVADTSNYLVTVRKNVYSLPIPATDSKEAAIYLPMTEDGFVSCGLATPFPFLGQEYSRIYISANGYIQFRNSSTFPSPYSSENFPSLASHFASPRLSFLFSDLSPMTGGSIWIRRMDDRFVLTVESMPRWNYSSPNTVQVELFYSGHMRVTYQDITANYAIVGISDGNGPVVDPATLFSGVRSVQARTDFSSFGSATTGVSIDPVPVQSALAGDVVSFTVPTRYPEHWATPTLSATWDGVGPVPFADIRDGTGVFYWQTTLADYGSYTVRILATSGGYSAYQDIAINVGIITPLPYVRNLLLRTTNPIEDPSRNRTVSDDVQLFAEYEYVQPGLDDGSSVDATGPATILWYRNNQLVSTFNGLTTVPSSATHPNDQWFFTVTPYTTGGVRGVTRVSPLVTIAALPEIEHVVRLEDLPAPDAFGQYPDVMPAAYGPTTGDTQVVILGRRLSHPVSVRVGGIEATSIRIVSDTRLEITTPAHVASPVVAGTAIPEDITIQTDEGVTIKRDVYTYVDAGAAIFKADVNNDGKVDAVDLQLVIMAVLETAKSDYDADVNRDGRVNSTDIQVVVNTAIGR